MDWQGGYVAGMQTARQVGLYLMSSKGLAVLRGVIDAYGPSHIGFVVYASDPGVAADWSTEIAALCRHHHVPCIERRSVGATLPDVSLLLAVSWRWLLAPHAMQQLVVLHDSLLPRYRGFAPLVNSLINGEPLIGVTAVIATAEAPVDSGPIVAQLSKAVSYPITIAQAIAYLEPVYVALALEVVERHQHGNLVGTAQDENQATFSPWLDDTDYSIDWTASARDVRRFVDAVGYPYRGAAAELDGQVVRVLRCVEHPSPMRLERAAAGKVLSADPLGPCVACGSGTVVLLDVRIGDTAQSALPLKRFRSRFGALKSQ
jgi:methionyl-tRNA formyltransferase